MGKLDDMIDRFIGRILGSEPAIRASDEEIAAIAAYPDDELLADLIANEWYDEA
jgi:hypothetical protein